MDRDARTAHARSGPPPRSPAPGRRCRSEGPTRPDRSMSAERRPPHAPATSPSSAQIIARGHQSRLASARSAASTSTDAHALRKRTRSASSTSTTWVSRWLVASAGSMSNAIGGVGAPWSSRSVSPGRVDFAPADDGRVGDGVAASHPGEAVTNRAWRRRWRRFGGPSPASFARRRSRPGRWRPAARSRLRPSRARARAVGRRRRPRSPCASRARSRARVRRESTSSSVVAISRRTA